MENQMQWLLDVTQSMNDKLSELVKITAGHSMALKILGVAVTIIAGGVVAIVIEIMEGRVK